LIPSRPTTPSPHGGEDTGPTLRVQPASPAVAQSSLYFLPLMLCGRLGRTVIPGQSGAGLDRNQCSSIQAQDPLKSTFATSVLSLQAGPSKSQSQEGTSAVLEAELLLGMED
jgi:hypothetical protein